MKIGRVLLALMSVLPASAQYAGPAILSRGEAPSALTIPDIRFRPFIEVFGVYDSGLAGVGVNEQGELASQASYGGGISWGVSGAHSWKKTRIGLDYHGSFSHYFQKTYYDSVDQTFSLGITHRLSRRATLTLRESAGIFSRDFGLMGIQQTTPFDPVSSYIPTTDFFDNRTIYLTSQADLTIQKTARLSFDLGGDGFINRRRSTALYGVVGAAARGDMQYRVTRRTTIGAGYMYNHLDYTRVFGGTDIHTVLGSYSVALGARTEFSAQVGAMRIESKFITVVPIDPAIVALLGISSGTQVVHPINYTSYVGGRFSHTLPKGVAYVYGGHGVTPGNGLFLTSVGTNLGAGYSYTGMRRWSLTVAGNYGRYRAMGNITGTYENTSGEVSLSRQLSRYMHFVMSYAARQYNSPDYSKYNRLIHEARVGFGFAPGEVPLKIR